MRIKNLNFLTPICFYANILVNFFNCLFERLRNFFWMLNLMFNIFFPNHLPNLYTAGNEKYATNNEVNNSLIIFDPICN